MHCSSSGKLWILQIENSLHKMKLLPHEFSRFTDVCCYAWWKVATAVAEWAFENISPFWIRCSLSYRHEFRKIMGKCALCQMVPTLVMVMGRALEKSKSSKRQIKSSKTEIECWESLKSDGATLWSPPATQFLRMKLTIKFSFVSPSLFTLAN